MRVGTRACLPRHSESHTCRGEAGLYYGHIRGATSLHSPPACDVVWITFLGAETTGDWGEAAVSVTPGACELALGGLFPGTWGEARGAQVCLVPPSPGLPGSPIPARTPTTKERFGEVGPTWSPRL